MSTPEQPSTERQAVDPLPPADPFPPADLASWRRRVERELGDASFEDALVYRSREGIDRQPLYTAESLPAGFDPEARPGEAPYLRGTRPAGGWRIAQEIVEESPGEAAAAMRSAQARGVTLLWLVGRGVRRGSRGVRLDGSGSFETLLAAVEPSTAMVLDAGEAAPAIAASWVAAAERVGREPKDLRGGFACDPLADLAAGGRLSVSLEEAFRRMAELAVWTRGRAPCMRAVLVSSTPYHDAGATAVDELAFAVATGACYLRQLTAAGLGIDAAARQLGFAFSVGRDLFAEIAKLRAARLLWSKVVAACGGGEAARAMRLHARSSELETSRLDPWMNLLRGGAQALAAVLGGADSVLTAPFDALSGRPGDAGRRLAVDLQHILAEEARLGRTADPGGGSWYLESLTDALARAAWRRFRELEGLGGMARCLTEGHVARRLREAAAALRRTVATRSEPILGASAFVQLAEEVAWEPVAPREGPPEAGSGASCPPLERFRLAEPFEALRRDSDRFRARTGRRPRVALVRLGERSGGDDGAFLRRLLAAVGLESFEAPDDDALAAAEPFELVLLAGGGAHDPERLAALVPRLRERGAGRVMVSGRAGERRAELEAAGVSGFVYDGCDLVALFAPILAGLGGRS